MILANLTLELKWMLGDDTFKAYADIFMDEIMNSFLDPETMLIRENILASGEELDSFEGRLINPGHGLEGMGFVMDVARVLGEDSIIKKAVEVSLSVLEFGWDKKYGGIFYFMDSRGKPPLSLEWDQKLWWVHLEALVTLSTAYSLTGDQRCWDWYEKVHKYTWEHFPDEQFGEWFGYLNRYGDPLLTLKGGKWKGFFHVPRSVFKVYQTFDTLEKTAKNKK
jgi:N-acylglucosamine 2-epimerase